ncbi:SNARE associated Golgi protein, putative [Babesia caballi]|uniref:SNARE associated Golgi protein, putative n=1 Tax=Babesia caballi TaxID=5871 RepID=A0AAV4M052_BABCB|nr:SNARE associated Golgi protein, putative [Babesia caballi]
MESSGTADLEGAVLDDDVVSSVRKPLLEEPAGEAPPNPWLARIIILLWLCMTPLAIYYRKEITEFVRYVASRGAEQGSLFYLYYVIVFVCTVACCVSLEIMVGRCRSAANAAQIISSGFVFSHIHGPLCRFPNFPGAYSIDGVLIGTALSFIAYFITMFLCFLLSRHLLKGVVHRYLRHYKYYGALIKATEREGFSLVAMIRLSPFFPPTIVSYIFGSTNVGTRDYCLATFAAIPSIGFFTYLGSLIEDLSDDAMTILYAICAVRVASSERLSQRDAHGLLEEDGDESKANDAEGSVDGVSGVLVPVQQKVGRHDDDGREQPVQRRGHTEGGVLVLSAQGLREVQPHDATEPDGETDHEAHATDDHEVLGPEQRLAPELLDDEKEGNHTSEEAQHAGQTHEVGGEGAAHDADEELRGVGDEDVDAGELLHYRQPANDDDGVSVLGDLQGSEYAQRGGGGLERLDVRLHLAHDGFNIFLAVEQRDDALGVLIAAFLDQDVRGVVLDDGENNQQRDKAEDNGPGLSHAPNEAVRIGDFHSSGATVSTEDAAVQQLPRVHQQLTDSDEHRVDGAVDAAFVARADLRQEHGDDAGHAD